MPPFPIYPEHEDPCAVLVAMQTQWRVGMAGATGLDYSVLPSVMDLLNIDREKRKSVFDDVRVMEAAVLDMKPAK